MQYTIGQFSKIINISEYTLRYYEKEKIITPNRLPNGRRYYTDKDITWMEFIKRLKDTKMPIKDIKKYANLRAIGNSTMQERMNLLIKHKHNLDIQIAVLNEHYKKLNEKINYYKNQINTQNK